MYSEETRIATCGGCGKTNHIVIAYAGDHRANEKETAECHSCGAVVTREECFAIFAAETAAGAIQLLRRLQNRA